MKLVNSLVYSSLINRMRIKTWLWILVFISLLALTLNFIAILFKQELDTYSEDLWRWVNGGFSILIAAIALIMLIHWNHSSKKYARVNTGSSGLFISFDKIIKEQNLSIKMLTAAIIIIAGSVALIAVPLSLVFGSGEADLFFGYFFGLISIIIAFLAMHYAFEAERMSNRLVEERGFFFEGFVPFIKRITRELNVLWKKIDQNIEREDEDGKTRKEGYLIKCIYLTPLLGHAALSAGVTGLYDHFRNHMKSIIKLLKTDRCVIWILTHDKAGMRKWYAHVEWIEQIKKMELNKSNTISEDLESEDLVEKVKSRLIKQGISGENIYDGEKKVFGVSYEYRKWIRRLKPNQKKNLYVAMGSDIPFQMCLVSKIKGEVFEKMLTKEKKLSVKPNDDIHEEFDFAIISLVGTRSYQRVVRAIKNGKLPNAAGIDYLFKKLHGIMFTRDKEFCMIVNQHFRHLWDDSEFHNEKKPWIYPPIQEKYWSNTDKYGLQS